MAGENESMRGANVTVSKYFLAGRGCRSRHLFIAYTVGTRLARLPLWVYKCTCVFGGRAYEQYLASGGG